MQNERNETMWLGLGRADITACVEGMSMWGWGASGNVATGVAMPLHARAVALAESSTAPPLVMVSVELGMVSEALRRRVLRRIADTKLPVDEHRLVLTANHTHSGPSGFSSYLLYALAGPGYSPVLVDRLADGIFEAISIALRTLRPGRVRSARGDIPLSEPVSVNRSLAAYNRNPEVRPLDPERSDEAVSRRMTVLRFEGARGEPRGMWATFAVHGTSVHADNQLLHPDNMGVAAAGVERMAKAEGHPDFVALFSQGPAGDVSPNYRFCARRGLMVGRYDDDFESAEWNGGIQARAAHRLCEQAASEPALEARVEGSIRYRALHEASADADLLPSNVREGRAGAACIGFGFARGTAEGPGPLGRAPEAAFRSLARLLELASPGDEPHSPKVKLCHLGAGSSQRITKRLRSLDLIRLLLPDDRRLRYYQSVRERSVTWARASVPHVLPFQVVRIGELAVGLVPFEPTTVAGRRIGHALMGAFGGTSVRETLVVGYANAYASYLTTPEEYGEQAYEGASTLFGRNALPVVGTLVRRIARDLVLGRATASLGDSLDPLDMEATLPDVDNLAGRARAGLRGVVDPTQHRPPLRAALQASRSARL